MPPPVVELLLSLVKLRLPTASELVEGEPAEGEPVLEAIPVLPVEPESVPPAPSAAPPDGFNVDPASSEPELQLATATISKGSVKYRAGLNMGYRPSLGACQ